MMHIYFFTFILFVLGSCSPQSSSPRQYPFDPYSKTIIDDQSPHLSVNQPPAAGLQTASRTYAANGKVAILLPLSGPHQNIGQAMLNAAQLALFDVNDPTFELLPIDTKGSAQGAAKAVHSAASQNAKLILGPLLSQSVQSAGRAAQKYNLNIVGFTTDSRPVGGHVLTLGILPYDQGKRLAQYAEKKNIRNILIVAPNNDYATAITSAFEKQTAKSNIVNIVGKIALHPQSDLNQISEKIASMSNQFDGLFVPMGNPKMAFLAEALHARGINSQTKVLMGAGLWDDPQISANPLMTNAIYAAPPPGLRHSFERQYRSLYNETPQRLASLAYDATALAVVIMRQTSSSRISLRNIMNPNGFSGIDGIFRFRNNGQAERGLAIHKITNRNKTAIIDQAPSSFLTNVGDFAFR